MFSRIRASYRLGVTRARLLRGLVTFINVLLVIGATRGVRTGIIGAE